MLAPCLCFALYCLLAPHGYTRMLIEDKSAFDFSLVHQQDTMILLAYRFALNLKYMSTSAYKAVRQSGILHLPSERTLADYTHWSSSHAGLQLEYIQRYHNMLEDVPCKQCHSVCLVDGNQKRARLQ